MRARFVRLVVALLGAAVVVGQLPSPAVDIQGSLAASSSAPTPPAFDGLATKAQAEGTVRVMVGLKAAFRPEGELPPSERQRQRRDLAARRNDLLADMRARGNTPRVLRAYGTVPYAALELTPAGVAALRTSGLAASVTEDRRAFATLADSSPLVGANKAWATSPASDGRGRRIVVLDEGVDKNHPFLGGRVVGEACFTENDCAGGADQAFGDGAGAPCTGCSHGTHVAGIALGRGGYSGGPSFSGVARAADLVSVRVLGSDGGTFADVVAALDWVAEGGAGPLDGIGALNMSFGDRGVRHGANCDPDYPALGAVIANLRSSGVPSAVASGNDGFITGMNMPACMADSVSVGSTSKTDSVASYSNTATFLSLLAPGGTSGNAITSSVPGGGFGTKYGTSMAAPHVAGAFAILRQRFPDATVDQLVSLLQRTGKPIVDKRPGTVSSMWITKPRIQINAALAAMDTEAPGVPPNVQAHAVNATSITVSWGPSTDNIGVASYEVFRGATSVGTTTATTFTDTGLSPQTGYTYQVRAADAAGNLSERSAPVSETTPASTPATELRFTPVADATVKSSSSSSNFGSAPTLQADANAQFRSYLRFSVSGIGAGQVVTSAKLRLRTGPSPAQQCLVHSVSTNSWLESRITWKTKPAAGALLGSLPPVAAGGWTEADVTSFVRGNGTFSMRVSTKSNATTTYSSREALNPADAPQLIVTTEAS